MKRSSLRNKFLNTKSDINRKAYNKQRNICATPIRQKKKNFYSKLNILIINNKTFWKKVKTFFTDKILTKSKMTLIEKELLPSEEESVIQSEEIISKDKAIA